MAKWKPYAIPLLGAFVGAVALTMVVAANGGTNATNGQRQIYLTAVEWKGSAEVAKEAYPTAALPEGGGYEKFAPDAAGKWSIETYRFDSAVVMAYEGERVTLNIFGVNAAYHDISIAAFNKTFRVNRGALAKTTFTVKKAGIYPIICLTHQPSHRADLVVLPRP